MLEWWYRALRSDYGVVIRTDDVERCKAQLYKARSETMDDELQQLSIATSPTDSSELWIVKRPKE